MRSMTIVVTFMLAGVFALLAQTDQPPGSKDVPTQCDELVLQRIAPSQTLYANELAALMKMFQTKGDLENALAVKKEKERAGKERRIEDGNIVHTPVELQNLQLKYRAAQGKIAQQTAKEFLTKLEARKKKLTLEGKLDEALAVKKDIEKIQRRYGDAMPYRTASIVGKWRRVAGSETFTFTFSADGGAYVRSSRGYSITGRWAVNQGKVVTTWDNGITDTVVSINSREFSWTNSRGEAPATAKRLE